MKQSLSKDWCEVPDGTIAWRTREFDPVAGISTDVTMYRTPDGKMRRREHRVRVYTATELTAMLRCAGLEPVSYWGGLNLSPFTPETRLMVLAVKV